MTDPSLTAVGIREQAAEHVLRLLTEQLSPDEPREHVAVLAWLDGYAAGHQSAMGFAQLQLAELAAAVKATRE